MTMSNYYSDIGTIASRRTSGVETNKLSTATKIAALKRVVVGEKQLGTTADIVGGLE